ncbi:hypothetical protein BWI93_05300 [Siphonobacter sp. BAB-5385]|uniref:hypothetical protein n=1 Tax=Siphonobacter sp. BAB-5385 TaxID=1864822 RepID=UPI000B9E4D78|nr:hypothetical protein [Siphonobacter sp. BAB-5385]OZI09163.1 hypothetical protein BWI93_05300 [Siphonobacter sp. BAB-5385]
MQKTLIRDKEHYLRHVLTRSLQYEEAAPGCTVPEWLPIPKPDQYPCVAIVSDPIREGQSLFFEIELVYFTDFLTVN